MYFSKTTNGFYDESLKNRYGDNWPSDALKISNELYISLLKGQTDGMLITSDEHGNPILIEKTLEPETEEELRRRVLSEKNYLLQEANNKIAPLQDAVDLDIAIDNELDELKSWKKYRVLLNRVEQQEGFHVNIVWPDKP